MCACRYSERPIRTFFDAPEQSVIDNCLQRAWRSLPRYEKAANPQIINHYGYSWLEWGWGNPQGEAGSVSRWAFTGCGLYLMEQSPPQLEGFSPCTIVITAYSKDRVAAGPGTEEGKFSLDFQAGAGELEFHTTTPVQKHDPRPLGFPVTRLTLAGKAIELSDPTLVHRHLPSV